jgi:hypothetical protein
VAGAVELEISGRIVRDDGVDVGVDDLIPADHVDDRQPCLALADPGLSIGIRHLVINDRLPKSRGSGGRQVHLLAGELAAVEGRFLGVDVQDRPEAACGVAAQSLASGGGAVARADVGVLPLGEDGNGGTGSALGDEAAGILAHERAVFVNAVNQLRPLEPQADPAVRHLVVDVQVEIDAASHFDGVKRVRPRGQQVRHRVGQAVARAHTQDERPGPLVRSERHLAGSRSSALGEGHSGDKVDRVPAQGEHHPVDVLGAEAVVHQRHVEGHDVGREGPVAHDLGRCVPGRAGRREDAGNRQRERRRNSERITMFLLHGPSPFDQLRGLERFLMLSLVGFHKGGLFFMSFLPFSISHVRSGGCEIPFYNYFFLRVIISNTRAHRGRRAYQKNLSVDSMRCIYAFRWRRERGATILRGNFVLIPYIVDLFTDNFPEGVQRCDVCRTGSSLRVGTAHRGNGGGASDRKCLN